MKIVIYIILSYLIGSIPNALWIGKFFLNKDVRHYGSGNVGATNAARVLGYKYGTLTLILDILKGAIPTIIGYSISPIVGILMGLSSVIGHTYSIYINFQGGKAVATTVGIFIIISPYSILSLVFVFFGIVYLTGYVSVASMMSAILLPIMMIVFKAEYVEILFALFIAILIVYRHRSNIKNLINKKEANFFDKVK